MYETITQCQFGTAAANGGPIYLWLYRILHTIASNLTTAFGSRVPGLRIPPLLALAPMLVLLPACTAHYSIHPGALNKTDSAAYDALLVAEATIDQARLAVQAGQLPAEAKDALEALIRSYNVARESWLTYRGAIATNVPTQVYFDQLTKNLSGLTTALKSFEGAR